MVYQVLVSVFRDSDTVEKTEPRAAEINMWSFSLSPKGMLDVLEIKPYWMD